jgi:hypothetical protein
MNARVRATGPAEGEGEVASLARKPVRAFDELIGRARHAMPEGSVASIAPAPGLLPFPFGPHAGRGVILARDTAVELGDPSLGSCSMTMSTSDETLVVDGRVTVAGPDPCEMPRGTAAPLAQVVIVAGPTLVGESHQAIEDAQTITDWVAGYMTRCMPGQVFARVSDELHDAGLTLAQLGRALIELAKSADERVTAAEALLVTSSPADVARMRELLPAWGDASHGLRRDAWMGRGLDIDCPSEGHCGACSDKAVCDQVRRIRGMRLAAAGAEAAHDGPAGRTSDGGMRDHA